ncbi:hypothetical protein MUK42_37614 [Musa troglodytarum]|uniref:Uncharacterized protein n=1 Tax=Musa troglodytarum TaxID=320322 RepID=A0A9E7HK41_9LILI|nr:hypothetical protein MUK42_37614 [Musa troglodytarum]
MVAKEQLEPRRKIRNLKSHGLKSQTIVKSKRADGGKEDGGRGWAVVNVLAGYNRFGTKAAASEGKRHLRTRKRGS